MSDKKVPQYADLRAKYPWLPASEHLAAIRGLRYEDDGSAVLTIEVRLPDGVATDHYRT